MQAEQETAGFRFRPVAVQPEQDLVAGALEGDAGPAAAPCLLEDEAAEVREPASDGVGQG